MRQFNRSEDGYTLPSVLILSVAMLSILTVSLQLVSASTRALDDQYNYQIAREASESGAVYADACLRSSGYVPEWTNEKPLRPNTDCQGNIISGASPYVLSSGNITTTFSVPRPGGTDSMSHKIAVNGSTSVSSGSLSRSTASYSGLVALGGLTGFDRVAFGYYKEKGVFFGLVHPDGKFTTIGYNGEGQLGTGNTSTFTSPQQFALPVGEKAKAAYTSFLSLGSAMFVATKSGDLHGSGRNSYGQLGNGTTASRQSTPVKFNLPAGVSPKYVTTLVDTTFVLGSNDRVYSVGRNEKGELGRNYNGAHDTAVAPVSLPMPNPADLNTIPESISTSLQSDNMVGDSFTVYIRMKGGRVYGWGENDKGQLGMNKSTVLSKVPVVVGSFGVGANPKARKLAFDGSTFYVMDDQGDVWSVGSNEKGALAGSSSAVNNKNAKCIDNPSNSTTAGVALLLVDCESTPSAGQLLEWTPEGEIKMRPNSTTERCIQIKDKSSSSGKTMILMPCDGSAHQKWEYRYDGKKDSSTNFDNSVYSVVADKCIGLKDNKVGSTVIDLHTCRGDDTQKWYLRDSPQISRVPLPTGKKAVDISSDQWSVVVLMDDGTVFSAGRGAYGQIGSGDREDANPALRQFILPAGGVAKSIYTTRHGDDVVSNTFVTLEDGRVFGAGTNQYGQLGIGSGGSTRYSTPVQMTLPAGVKARSVQSGLGTTVILSAEGQVYTVGNNSHGQLGDGTTSNNYLPRANTYVNDSPALFF